MQANEIPENLKNAVIAIEDGRFYNHNGIDPIGLRVPLSVIFAEVEFPKVARPLPSN